MGERDGEDEDEVAEVMLMATEIPSIVPQKKQYFWFDWCEECEEKDNVKVGDTVENHVVDVGSGESVLSDDFFDHFGETKGDTVGNTEEFVSEIALTCGDGNFCTSDAESLSFDKMPGLVTRTCSDEEGSSDEGNSDWSADEDYATKLDECAQLKDFDWCSACSNKFCRYTHRRSTCEGRCDLENHFLRVDYELDEDSDDDLVPVLTVQNGDDDTSVNSDDFGFDSYSESDDNTISELDQEAFYGSLFDEPETIREQLKVAVWNAEEAAQAVEDLDSDQSDYDSDYDDDSDFEDEATIDSDIDERNCWDARLLEVAMASLTKWENGDETDSQLLVWRQCRKHSYVQR